MEMQLESRITASNVKDRSQAVCGVFGLEMWVKMDGIENALVCTSVGLFNELSGARERGEALLCLGYEGFLIKQGKFSSVRKSDLALADGTTVVYDSLRGIGLQTEAA